MLFDCVNLPWPVLCADGRETWALDYYLAYYLPAAVVGKFTSYAGAQVALWIWSSLGLALTWFWFAQLSRLTVGIAAVGFFLFSGWDFFANLLVQFLGLADNHGVMGYFPNPAWARDWRFLSHYWMYQWSPGQALIAWLAAGLFLNCPQKLRTAAFAFLFTCAMLWTPLVSIGLLLLFFFWNWRERAAFNGKLLLPASSLIFPLGALVAFYAAKVSPDVAARFGKIPVGWFTQFHYGPASPLQSMILLLLFIPLEFGIYLWFIRARFAKDTPERKLADACGLALLALLPVTMGYESDLSMRASAVPLFGLAVLLARTLPSTSLSLQWRRWLWLYFLMCSLTPVIQSARQGHNLLIHRFDPRTVPHQVSAVLTMPGHDHLRSQYLGSTNSFFTHYLARKP